MLDNSVFALFPATMPLNLRKAITLPATGAAALCGAVLLQVRYLLPLQQRPGSLL